MAKLVDLPPDHPSFNRIWIGPVIMSERVRAALREAQKRRVAAEQPPQPEPEPPKPEPPKRDPA